jgi:signal transduction histidine kinase
VNLDINMHGTLDLALALQPDVTQVFVVAGGSDFDRFYEDVARSQFQQYANRLTFTYLSGLAMDALEERLAHLPERSIVYFLMFTSDGAGRRWLPLDSLDRLTGRAIAPVYHWVETAVGHGVVGGSVMTLALPARVVAEQAVRIINGEPADNIPVQKIDPNLVTIDWRQLRRWNISESRVPATAVVKFREATAWQKYRVYIIGAGTLVVLQTVLIAVLAVNRANRRRAQSALRESYARIRDLAGRLINAQEAERASIARDLHDDVGQRVASFSIALGTLKRRLTGADEVVRADLASLQRETVALSKDLRLLSHELHPGLLQQLGLVEALRARCDEIEAESDLSVVLDVGADLGKVSDEVSLCLYRVAQEALRNVVNHARARTVRLSLARHDGHLDLRISDDGCGLPGGQVSSHHGLGLVSLEERVRMLGGTFTIDSSDSSGTTVSVSIPCDDSDATTARAVGR